MLCGVQAIMVVVARAVVIAGNIESCWSSSSVVGVGLIIQTNALSAATWRPIEVQFEYQQWRCFLLWREQSRLNIGISALLFFVPNKSVNHACIGGGSLCYQVGLVRMFRRSILRDVVRVNLVHRLNFVVAQAVGVVSFIATAQQKFKHRTGYTQPLLIQHRLQPAG